MNDPVSAYDWLKRGEDYFLYTLHELIGRMHAQAEAGHFSAALESREGLEAANQAVDRLNQAKIRLECAVAASKMHNPSLAVQELETALELLGPGADSARLTAHTYAMASWILGLLMMPVNGPAITAATAWQDSLKAFEYLSNEPDLTNSDQRWYLDRREEMLQAIHAGLSGRSTGTALQPATLQAGRQTSIDVFDELSTSRYGPTGHPPNPANQLLLQPYLDEFSIGRWPYRLFSLRGPRRTLALDSAKSYLSLQVISDWMNWVGVEPGDYILFNRQEEAENGDIVVVEIPQANPSAMVYQLVRKKGALLFKPQSANPAHNAFEFGLHERDKYHLYGIVLGVFKPSSPGQPAPPAPPAAPAQEEAPIPIEDYIQAFPLYSEIPAGGPRVAPTFTGRYMELDRFIIDDKPYTVVNLRGADRLIKPRSGNLVVLKVTGNSMNDPEKANIQDGDYVLLLRQDTAQDNDIVAAEIRGEDSLATLKRYREQAREIRLVPESIDPEFMDPKYQRVYVKRNPAASQEDQPFYVRGIALAVFKPYPSRP